MIVDFAELCYKQFSNKKQLWRNKRFADSSAKNLSRACASKASSIFDVQQNSLAKFQE